MSANRFDLSGRNALVTGGGRGLGRAAALAFAQSGARVGLCARSLDEIEETVRMIRKLGADAFAIPTDVVERRDCEHAVAEVVGRYGSIDFALCAAGVIEIHDAEQAGEEEWRRVVDINLTGTFNSAQTIGRQMIRQGNGGSIIVVSSNASMVAFPGLLAYNASKGGVDQLVRTFAAEWGKHGIRVNAIAPGYMDNAMRGTRRKGGLHDDRVRRQIEELTPLARTGSNEEFVGPAIFLASDASGFITGAIIPVDGGYTAL